MRKRNNSAVGIAAGVGLLGLVALSLGTPDGCGATEGLIGPEGGVVRSADGRFTLEIPEGALNEPVKISVRAVDCEQDYEADCYQVSPSGVGFSFPAVATYEAAELPTMESISLSMKGQTGWQQLPDLIVDEEDEFVSASVLYLSSIAVLSQ